jgi:sensor histidine kinase regulating citrate/malate metabolism
MSVHSDDVELGAPGMAPKVQEKMRRKSVSSKAAEVVTIGEFLLKVAAASLIGRSNSTRLGEEAERGQGCSR